MKQADANLPSLSNALQQDMSAEEYNAFQANRHELDYIMSGAEAEGQIQDNKRILQGQLNDFKQITGKDLFKNTVLIWLLFASLVAHNVLNWHQGLHSGMDDDISLLLISKSETGPPISSEPENDNSQHYNNKNNKGKIMAPQDALKEPGRSNELAKHQVTVADSITMNTQIFSAENKYPVDYTFSSFSDWLPIDSCRDTKKRFPISINTENISSESTVIIPEPILFDLQLSDADNLQYYTWNFSNHSANIKEVHKFKIAIDSIADNRISIPDLKICKTLYKRELLLLKACVNGHQKTDLAIKKDMIIFISSHGTISSSACNSIFNAEGLSAGQVENSNCEPFIEKYNPGALLFKFGENDNWKPYLSTQTKIIADKDGVLEFLINLKTPADIKGNYSVSVSRSINTR